MTTEQISISRIYDNGRRIAVELSGTQSLDDVIDAFRGVLLQMGYPASIAGRLDLRDEDEGGDEDDDE